MKRVIAAMSALAFAAPGGVLAQSVAEGSRVRVKTADFRSAGKPADVNAFLDDIEGRSYWLKIDVVRVNRPFGGTDPTHVGPDGRVYYRGRIGTWLAHTQTSDPEEFVRAVHRSLVEHPDLEMDPRVWRPGSEVTIHATSAKKRCALSSRASCGSRRSSPGRSWERFGLQFRFNLRARW